MDKLKKRIDSCKNKIIALIVFGVLAYYVVNSSMTLFFYQNKIKHIIIPLIFIIWIYLYKVSCRKYLNVTIHNEETRIYVKETLDLCKKKNILSFSKKYYDDLYAKVETASEDNPINLYDKESIKKRNRLFGCVIVFLVLLMFVPIKEKYKWYDSMETSMKRQLILDSNADKDDIVAVVDFEEYSIAVNDNLDTYLFRKKKEETGDKYSFIMGCPTLVTNDTNPLRTIEDDVRMDIFSNSNIIRYTYYIREKNIFFLIKQLRTPSDLLIPIWGFSKSDEIEELKISDEPIDGIKEIVIGEDTYYLWWKDEVSIGEVSNYEIGEKKAN